MGKEDRNRNGRDSAVREVTLFQGRNESEETICRIFLKEVFMKFPKKKQGAAENERMQRRKERSED